MFLHESVILSTPGCVTSNASWDRSHGHPGGCDTGGDTEGEGVGAWSGVWGGG